MREEEALDPSYGGLSNKRDQTPPSTFKQLDRNKSVTIATTTLSRIRGFTVELLFHFRNRELRVADLIDLTGKYRQYINVYLHRMRNYGLVERNGSSCKLTEIGLSFLSYLKSLDNNNIHNITLRKQKENIKKTDRKQKENTSAKKTPKQISIKLWLQESGRTLDDAEKVVVEVLVDHYNKTGSKFYYCEDDYEAARKFGIRPDQVTQVLRNLKEGHIAYTHRDTKAPGGPTWKIGLYKAFIETLKASQKVD